MTSAIPEVPAPGRHSFVERVIGALRLDAATYEEVEHDPSSLGQAAGVVAVAALAAAIGTASRGGSAPSARWSARSSAGCSRPPSSGWWASSG